MRAEAGGFQVHGKPGLHSEFQTRLDYRVRIPVSEKKEGRKKRRTEGREAGKEGRKLKKQVSINKHSPLTSIISL
jgi:hypothetical protein